MVVREVLMIGNPKLREECEEIAEFNNELKVILTDLKDSLAHLQKTRNIGRALAAPQIGHMKKVIYMQTPTKTIIMINPKITWKSEEMFKVWDTCFSFDVAFFVKIKRYKKIKVEYQDEKSNSKIEEFEGDLSELFQHEIDHLYGVLATDYLQDNKQIIMRSELEREDKNG